MSRVGTLGRAGLVAVGIVAVWSVVATVALEKNCECLDDRFFKLCSRVADASIDNG
jgi:hypothetical protein